MKHNRLSYAIWELKEFHDKKLEFIHMAKLCINHDIRKKRTDRKRKMQLPLPWFLGSSFSALAPRNAKGQISMKQCGTMTGSR